MKLTLKSFIYVVFASLFTFVSCVEEANDGAQNAGEELSAVSEQAASVNNSLELLNSLHEVVEMDLSGIQSEMENHVKYLKSGVSSVDATMATLQLQKNVAAVVGELQADGFESLSRPLAKSVKSWLGKDFVTFFDVAVYRGKAHAIAKNSALKFTEQYDIIDAYRSDVEAGLREGVEVKELDSVAAQLQNNISKTGEIAANADAILEELEVECSVAIEAMLDESAEFNAETLKKANAQAAAQVKSAEPTISSLAASIETMQNQITSIDSRLSKLEADVEELLGMIQSVTFLSDYSEDYAIAYYEMEDTKVSAPGKAYDGKNQRDAAGTIALSYMVRPASAAVAVTSNVVSVVGYYANQIQTKAVDPSQFVNFEVQGVQLTNAERGIVTVTLSHDLKDDFYYKATGAKCALFIATGKTDVSSKFVELIPKDNSTTVYVEGLKINTDDFEIDEGQSKTLTATVNPSSATNKTIKWTSSNTEIATIDQYSGVLTAVKQGNVTITATTNGIDEWGDNLTASVNVKVNPSIRLGGPLYVEEGKTAELSLDFPPAMNVESKVWLSSDETKATVENGIVTGVAHTYSVHTYQYNPVTITCIVNGNITLTHEMSVAVPQPRQIKLNNYGDDVKSVSMKLDQTISLAGSILPANVDPSLFRMTYESDGGLGWIDFSSGEIKSPGSVGGRYVYIKVKDIDKHTYMKTFVERTVIVNVEPYYVKSISFADVELEPGANVTLVPTFTSDVSGKQPTNTKLIWESSNSQIATVDENGLVNALGEGDVTITATATDGSGVKGTCKVTIAAPWKEFEVGQYVVRRTNGEIDFFSSSTDAKNNGTVVGVVIYKGNPRVSDTKLPSTCTHGIAVGLGQGTSGLKWWSGTNNAEPYNLYKYTIYCPEDGFVSPVGVSYASGSYYRNDYGQKPYGYNNTMLFKTFMSKYGITSDLVNNLNNYNVQLPNETSAWYLPSIYEMYLVYQAYKNNSLDSTLSAVGGSTLANWQYWTVSEVSGNENSYAGTLNPVTGAVSYKQKTTTSSLPYTRYVFAF